VMGKKETIRSAEHLIKELISALVGRRSASEDWDGSLLELGIHSVQAVELIDALNARLGTELGVEAVFDYGTIRELAAYAAEQQDAVAAGGKRRTKKAKPTAAAAVDAGRSQAQRRGAEQPPEPGRVTAQRGASEAGAPERQREEDAGSAAGARTAGEVWGRQAIAASIVRHVERLLPAQEGDGGVRADHSFIELGLNSVTLVELIEQVNCAFGTELGIEAVYDYPVIADLAAAVERELGLGLGAAAESSAVAAGLAANAPGPSADGSADIAIIGVAGRFAGADDIEQFWQRLERGDCLIGSVNRPGWTSGYGGGMLERIDRFDAGFFGIPPHEAERMDPQQRLFLEEAYKVFEHAGYAEADLSGRKVGVFVGGRASAYGRIGEAAGLDAQLYAGNEMSVLAARISYHLNLKGPSLTVDTACSSSLVAVHLACASIRKQESEMAVAGGVFVASSEEFFDRAAQAGMLSPDGQCRPFDEQANGMVLGEGVGAVLLKLKDAALRDGDAIYGIIKGSAVQQAGRTNGIGTPSMLAQKELVRDAYLQAGVSPETVGYVEAHGTGTPLGDALELKGLTEAFRTFTDRTRFCLVGSHKPNFGHAAAAAGMGGIMKILMAFKYGSLPPTLGLTETNARIDLRHSPFYMDAAARTWKRTGDAPRRAAVSALGANGTNAHLLLEEPPERPWRAERSGQLHVFPFSAKTPEALAAKLTQMRHWLEREGACHEIADIAYTLCVGRSHFSQRVAVVASDAAELLMKLRQAEANVAVREAGGSGKPDGTLVFAPAAEEGAARSEDEVQLLRECVRYMQGQQVEWRRLLGQGPYVRVPLPAYPFQGQAFWIGNWASAAWGRGQAHVQAQEQREAQTRMQEQVQAQEQVQGKAQATAQLHPLLHRNTSLLEATRFTASFTGAEYFLADHRVGGQPILSGAAVLEMVRAALCSATDKQESGERGIRFQQVMWLRPMAAGEYHVRLRRDPADGAVAFEVYSESREAGVSHSRGKLARLTGNAERETQLFQPAEALRRCTLGTVDRERIYAAFRQMNIDYGPAHQAIARFDAGEGEGIARLILPAAVADSAGAYYMHPSMLDAALQTASLLIAGIGRRSPQQEPQPPSVAFMLQEAVVTGPSTAHMWVWVRLNAVGKQVDITIYDDEGRSRMELKGLTLAAKRQSPEVKDSVTAMLVATAAQVLDVRAEDMDLDSEWHDCGFDRIRREQFIERLNQALPVEAHVGWLAEYPTLGRLAERLTALCGDGAPGGQAANRRLKGGLQLRELDQALARLLLGQLQSLGYLREAGRPVGQLPLKAGQAYLEPWLAAGISFLEEHGLLRRDGAAGLIAEVECIDLQAEWRQWEATAARWLNDADYKAQVELVDAALRALPAIVRGQLPAVHVLFPDSSMRRVEGIFKHNRAADYFNEVVAEAVAAYVEERIDESGSARIRLIEIGAGTGGTSETVFRKLLPYQAHIEEYCYTDISKAFLLHADQAYGAQHRYATFKLLNVEQPVEPQGFEQGAYDLVIATNVLHATRNIKQTLRHTQSLLRPGGRLLLNEISGTSLFTHLTFGLLEGWWRYEDAELRIPGCPGLHPHMWERVLQESGFQRIAYPARAYHDSGQQVVVAAVAAAATSPRTDVKPAPAVQAEGAPNAAWSARVQAAIVGHVAQALQVEPGAIRVDEPFRDYGIDSILGVNLVQSLNDTLGIELDPTCLFDYSSVSRLAGYIEAEARGGAVRLPELSVPSVPSAAPERADKRIAIIGLSGRFPKSRTVDELWAHLEQGDDLTETAQRPDFPPSFRADGRNYCQTGGFLDEIDRFDSAFFHISGREATYMDPQQRLFLEEAWSALEDAGYAGESIEGSRTGVYAGCRRGDYDQLFDDRAPAQAFWGNEGSLIPARISYFLNLQGPAVAVDTACSSSLVAIHLACEDLQSGKIGLALAGGVFVSSPAFYASSNRAGMLSASGHCHTFDESADGFVPGEGVGVLVLKLLRQALADGDHIYGVIAGSGTNQDGATNGITAPSAQSQERLIRSVYDTHGIDPAHIQLVEAHGTGTVLGDPIEFKALSRSFRQQDGGRPYCAIGSIKTNMGHAVTAAGVAGVIKILLALKHKKIPPSLHFQTGNPAIDFAGSPFYVNTSLRDWPAAPGRPRAAAVSSFGFSGTNAHLVLEEAPPAERAPSRKPAYVFTLSARSREELRQQAERLGAFLQREPQVNAGNLSFTLLMGRRHLAHRLACVAESVAELAQALADWLAQGKAGDVWVAEAPEAQHGERSALQRFGNHCLESAKTARDAAEYTELLATAAELYVQGYALRFAELFAAEPHGRIPLPAYPFVRRRHWVPEREAAAARIGPEPQEQPAAAAQRPITTAAIPGREGGAAGVEAIDAAIAPSAAAGAEVIDAAIVPAAAASPAAVKEPPTQAAVKAPPAQAAAGKVWLRPLSGQPALPGDREQPALVRLPDLAASASERPLDGETQQAVQDANRDAQSAAAAAAGGFGGAAAEAATARKEEDGVLFAELVQLLSEALSNEPDTLDADRKFIDMGMDSIIGVEWIQSVNRRFGLAIKATKVYEYPTLREFGRFVGKQVSSGVSRPHPSAGPAVAVLTRPAERAPQPAGRAAAASSGPHDGIAELAPPSKLQAELVESLSRTLDIDLTELDPNQKFIDMGMDSILGVEWIQALNRRYRLAIKATKIYDYPTVREFAGFLQKELDQQTPAAERVSPAGKLSFDEILLQVQQGNLDVDSANRMLAELSQPEEENE